MFYCVDFPASLYCHAWTWPMHYTLTGSLSFYENLFETVSMDAYDWDNRFLDEEEATRGASLEINYLGPTSWASNRPGGPGYGTELGGINQFPSNVTHMNYYDI